MVAHMKTTIELSDALLEEAKRVAARDGSTLRELVESGLRRILRERAADRGAYVPRDARVSGRGLQPELRGRDWRFRR